MEEKASKRFSPKIYIATSQGTMLALCKAIESVAILCVIAWMYKSGIGTGKLLLGLAESFNSMNYSSVSPFSSIIATELIVLQLIEWGVLFSLILTLFDCIGAVLLRLTGRFSGLIRFIHTLIYVSMLLGLVLSLVGILNMFSSLIETGFNRHNYYAGLFLSIASMALLGMGITFSYHRHIISIMKTIGKERKEKKKRALKKKNNLPRDCANLIFLLSIVLIATIAAYLLENNILKLPSPLSGIAWISSSLYEAGYSNNILANILICVFLIIKYSLVRSCSNEYNRIHR